MQQYLSTPSAHLEGQEFQEFYQENLGPIYRYVYSKVRNREEAEDLTSKIFLKAIRNMDYSRNPRSTRNWLYQVSRTTIADYWRAHFRLVTSSLEVLQETGWEGPAENEDEPIEFSSTADSVQRILQALSERHREVLTCRFLLGLSVRETAERMGLTEGNVKTLQFRALKRAADFEYAVN